MDDVVFSFSEDLRLSAVRVAAILRKAGRSVDLVLEPKKAKWAFKHADRAGASRMVLVAPEEWARGVVKVKDLATGEQHEARPEQL